MAKLETLNKVLQMTTRKLISGKESPTTAGDLTRVPIRDAVLRFAYDNPELRPVLSANLQKLVTSANPETHACIHTLCAGIIWMDGDKENTKAELKLALEADSQYSLARLLDLNMVHDMPNSIWNSSIGAVSPTQCLTGAV